MGPQPCFVGAVLVGTSYFVLPLCACGCVSVWFFGLGLVAVLHGFARVSFFISDLVGFWLCVCMLFEVLG